MNNKKIEEEIKEINTEDFLSSIFIILGILSIYANQIQKKYIKTKIPKYKENAEKIFNLIIFITSLLYLFFLYRNYKNYQNAPEEKKEIFKIRLLGSCFFLAGIICTIYFNLNNKTYEGVPEL